MLKSSGPARIPSREGQRGVCSARDMLLAKSHKVRRAQRTHPCNRTARPALLSRGELEKRRRPRANSLLRGAEGCVLSARRTSPGAVGFFALTMGADTGLWLRPVEYEQTAWPVRRRETPICLFTLVVGSTSKSRSACNSKGIYVS
ncbi:hypothetical protein Mucpa_6020 [Mucilaginibacter paludis DSM 18603]|uniref:Uncharacterized protein n=1 Tax=Mucilaginibacter paludis DSM 18603 TaxID=714943 RepID=H1YC88_9SPHI|nr:hypothetical protein Mucpa_6020 [Mucilaginibacter paludis DSM 18603]